MSEGVEDPGLRRQAIEPLDLLPVPLMSWDSGLIKTQRERERESAKAALVVASRPAEQSQRASTR
jgi:hypothetical protein